MYAKKLVAGDGKKNKTKKAKTIMIKINVFFFIFNLD
jgi:hypothetical protein